MRQGATTNSRYPPICKASNSAGTFPISGNFSQFSHSVLIFTNICRAFCRLFSAMYKTIPLKSAAADSVHSTANFLLGIQFLLQRSKEIFLTDDFAFRNFAFALRKQLKKL